MRGGDWLRPLTPDDGTTPRLFLLPYSGAGVSVYHGWGAALGAAFAAYGVQLPGRQDRRNEPPYAALEPLLAALADAVAAELDGRPYAVFGHSFGALLGYRLALRLPELGCGAPALLAASGWAPAGFIRAVAGPEPSDEAIGAWLAGNELLPPDTAADPELRALTVPVLRADLAVLTDWTDDGAVVDCPVVSYSGREDPLMTAGAMASWAARTRRYLGDRRFPGGHLFLHEHSTAIAVDLAGAVRSGAGRR